MATRNFELPGIEQLTKEQEQVRALPKSGQHLVVGGPGTGKSVMALLRARRLSLDQERYHCLVYNHLLQRANQHLFGDGLSAATWMSWFIRMFRERCGCRVPRLPARAGSTFRGIAWEEVLQVAALHPPPDAENMPFLVVDEGQDMPPSFYRALVAIGFENFFVACDQNQQITDSNSSRQDIQDCLALAPSAVIELSYNHRNSFPVARLAREFYTGNPASPPPALPPSRSSRVPTLYEYESTRHGSFSVARRILQWVDRQPSRLVGVIAPNNAVRERYHKALVEAASDMSLDNAPPLIETFHSSHRPAVTFDQGGILVINTQACKGLEFDDVMLADIEQHYVPDNDLDTTRQLFYVMVSRARDHVFMFQRQGRPSRVSSLLPSDPSILRRRTL